MPRIAPATKLGQRSPVTNECVLMIIPLFFVVGGRPGL